MVLFILGFIKEKLSLVRCRENTTNILYACYNDFVLSIQLRLLRRKIPLLYVVVTIVKGREISIETL